MDLRCQHLRSERVYVRDASYWVDESGVCLGVDKAHADLLMQNRSWSEIPSIKVESKTETAPQPSDETKDMPIEQGSTELREPRRRFRSKE